MVGACVISDEYSASFRWVIFRKSKSRLYCHKLGKGEKVIHYTRAHTHRVHTIMGGQGDCPIVFDFFKDRIITPTIIRDFNLRVGYI